MPAAVLAYSDPFGNGARPYLALHLTGINGASGAVVGLLDSGADVTSLPLGYASLMGYRPETLTSMIIGTAGAPAQAHRANQPCAAEVIGIEGVKFELHPVFVSNATPLWGRSDFMRIFRVLFDEVGQRFELHW
jgi:hypothetical protein